MKPANSSSNIDEVLNLAQQLRAGHSSVEAAFMRTLEQTAELLSLDDPTGFVNLVTAIQDVPLHTAVSRQKVAYYYATALRRTGQTQLAVQAFADLLAEPDLELTIHGRALNSQAVGYRLLGQPEKATINYRQSLALWQTLQDAENQGKVHLNMGIMAYELRNYAEAEWHLRQSLEFLATLGLSKLMAIAQNELGLVYRDLGNWEAALACFHDFMAQRQQDGATENVAIAHLNIGEIQLYQGQLAAAEQSLQAALALMQAPAYRIDMLLHLGLTYQARADYQQALTTFAQALELAAQIERREFLPHIYYHLGDVRRLLGDEAGAFVAWETAVSLIENSREPIQDATIRISLLGRWQQIYEALLLHCLANGDHEAAFAWAERARARAFGEGLLAGLHAVVSLADLQAALPSDTAVLCYFTTGVLAWDMPMLQAIPADNPLRQHILLPPKIILFAISKQETAVHLCPLDPNKFATASPRGQDITRYLQPAVTAKLAEALLAPAAAAYQQAAHLILIPHGPLHHVPFTAVLANGAGTRPFVTMVPSATVWWQQQTHQVQPGRAPALALGYPAENLLFAEVEATVVAQLMQGDLQIGRIDKTWLRETAVDRRLLHFACHAQFEDSDPLSSYLELGQDEKLTAREVLASWQLSAELVILSACQTGLSHILRGDEPMGLIRAFLSAGAQSVLATQWPVEDLPAFLLILHLVQQLAASETESWTVAVALHRSQDWLRQLMVVEIQQILAQWQAPPASHWLANRAASEQLFADPVYWAGFILIGQ